MTLPILFVAGSLDHLGAPGVLMQGFARVASTDKHFEVMGRANGYRADYGHLDLTIGRHAPEEVYPLLLDWLQAHDR